MVVVKFWQRQPRFDRMSPVHRNIPSMPTKRRLRAVTVVVQPKSKFTVPKHSRIYFCNFGITAPTIRPRRFGQGGFFAAIAPQIPPRTLRWPVHGNEFFSGLATSARLDFILRGKLFMLPLLHPEFTDASPVISMSGLFCGSISTIVSPHCCKITIVPFFAAGS